VAVAVAVAELILVKAILEAPEAVAVILILVLLLRAVKHKHHTAAGLDFLAALQITVLLNGEAVAVAVLAKKAKPEQLRKVVMAEMAEDIPSLEVWFIMQVGAQVPAVQTVLRIAPV
jgi:hypothetical protein